LREQDLFELVFPQGGFVVFSSLHDGREGSQAASGGWEEPWVNSQLLQPHYLRAGRFFFPFSCPNTRLFQEEAGTGGVQGSFVGPLHFP
jgi:hypothetical protein